MSGYRPRARTDESAETPPGPSPLLPKRPDRVLIGDAREVGGHLKAWDRATSYAALGSEIGQLVDEKQKAYGDSFGKSGAVLRILYPDGIPPEKLDDSLTITRIVDKLFRIATDRDALGESPWRDIAGYALLAAKRSER